LDNLIGQFAPANAKFASDNQNARIIVDAAASRASPNQPAPARACARDTYDSEAVKNQIQRTQGGLRKRRPLFIFLLGLQMSNPFPENGCE
jgi:hypothetical protein